MQTLGLYIHVPFCVRKCPYCDFYSLPLSAQEQLDRYTQGVLDSLDRWADRLPAKADTLYLGGGTPALLGGERLAAILRRADERYHLFAGEAPEVTLEANPADDLAETLKAFAAAGGNRLSLGMQSACAEELSVLGRRHTPADVQRTVEDARCGGIHNISLDVMLGISGQTEESARLSVERAAQLGANHISAYLLKIEPDTPYGVCPPPLPDDDAAVDTYMAAMERLDELGYRQYEISNTARPGFESRHNLKYWDSQPYLGIGPAASSCAAGHRFTYPRDIGHFLAGGEPIEDPTEGIPVGSAEEYALLRLRLAEGIRDQAYRQRYGESLPKRWRQRAAALPAALVRQDEQGIRLTREGFMLSNTLITHIIG